MTKTEMAENFGIQRTSLSRELRKMKQAGLVEYDSETITLMII
jgi:DNA-binding transcriptional regulator GbsR (MarR family)